MCHIESWKTDQSKKRKIHYENITVVEINLTKNVFSVHGVNVQGKAEEGCYRRQVAGVFCQHTTMPDWFGGLHRRLLQGTSTA